MRTIQDIDDEAADRALRDIETKHRTDLKGACLNVALGKTKAEAPVEEVVAYASRLFAWLSGEPVN